jgi:hypothetical protein
MRYVLNFTFQAGAYITISKQAAKPTVSLAGLHKVDLVTSVAERPTGSNFHVPHFM